MNDRERLVDLIQTASPWFALHPKEQTSVAGEIADAILATGWALDGDKQKLREIINEQADDGGLWFQPVYITEDYLQCALRRLHAAIEGVSQEESAIRALTDAPSETERYPD